MEGLKHPAEEAAERLATGEAFDLDQLDRAELKYTVHALTEGEVFDAERVRSDVFDNEGSATVTREELKGLTEFVGELAAEGGD